MQRNVSNARRRRIGSENSIKPTVGPAPYKQVRLTTFVSGPYGRSEPVGGYETVLAVASDFGIAGVAPYIKKLLYGYNTSSARVRRVHLVWQVRSMGS
jgi:NAD(P)H-flavin reductase